MLRVPARSAPGFRPVRVLPTLALLLLAGCSAAGVPPGGAAPEPEERPPAAAVEEGPDTGNPEPAGGERDADVDPALAEAEPDSTLAAERPGPDVEPAAGAGGDVALRTLRGLSLRDKAAQLMMPIVLGTYTPKGTPGHDRIARLVEEEKVGGIIVSVGTPADVAVKLNDLQSHAEVPLLVAADLETGAGFRMKGAIHVPTNIVLGGATDFPSLMALGATGDAGLAYEMGRITALEARATGIHVPFAPVLDVNSNPDNPIINVRSFGEDPAQVATLGAAFVRGVQEHGAIATGKHFPGHGDTETDSHLALPVIRADRTRLDTLELRPFRRAIEEGMGGVMTAHIAVPSLNGGGEEPSTLSPGVLEGLLRRGMGFEGLIFTDAMDMGAIDRLYDRGEAAVRAVEAGADVVLMPPSVDAAIQGIVDAVCSGRLPEERVDSSVVRILRAKERMGLFRNRAVSLDSLPTVVGIPDHEEVAGEVARRSITLLRNEGDLLPLLGTRSARVLSVTYRRTNDLLASRWFDGRLRSTYPRLTTVDVLRDSGPEVYERLDRAVERSALVVVSLYVTAVSYSGSVAIPEETADFIQSLEERGVPHVVISFGNPYLLGEFPDARAYILAWSGSEASQKAAADALFGRFDIEGRTPTRLPPFFEIGDGIFLPARGAAGAR